MHQRLQRLLVALLVFVMFTSHITTTMVKAENNPEEPNKIEVVLTEEKKKELGIIQTTSIFEYADVLKNLNVSIQKKSSNLNSSGNDDLDLCRAIVKGTPLFDGFSPVTIVETPYGQYLVQFATQIEAEEFVKAQENVKSVEWAELDQVIMIDDQVEDESYETESDEDHLGSWGTSCIEAPEMVEYIKQKIQNGDITNDEIIVAVIDSGVDNTHEFLKNHITKTVDGVSLVDQSDGYVDTNGHGTHVSGTVVDCTLGLNITILSIKVGIGKYFFNTETAIRMAADLGATVINCSFGGHVGAVLVEAVEYAVDKGCVVCAAAGNDSTESSSHFPSATVYPGVICVSAINNYNNSLSYTSFTNYGDRVDVGMPGERILSSVPNNQYDLYKGTSMATPHASASAALIKMLYRDINPAETEALMKYITKDLGMPGVDPFYGYGVVSFSKLIEHDINSQEINIISQPVSVYAEEGHAARFMVEAENVIDYNWQYRCDGQSEWMSFNEYDNGINELGIIASYDNDDYQYRCELFSPSGNVYSDIVTLTVLPHGTAEITDSGICGDSMEWCLIDNVLYITGSGQMYDYTRKSTPWYLWRDKVEYIVYQASGDNATIGNCAFADFKNLFAIVSVPSEIDNLYFDSSYLPDNICQIGDMAFYNCSNLQRIIMPEDLISIGDFAFAACMNMKGASLNDGLETIGEFSFMDCSKIANDIYVPKSLNCIFVNTFFNCSSLTSVLYMGTYDEWLSINPYHSFEKAPNTFVYFKLSNLTYYGYGTGVGHELYFKGSGNLPDLGRPDNYPWFNNWDGLSDIYFLDGITGVFGDIFYGYNIYEVHIPLSMQNIGDYVFGDNDSIDVFYDGKTYSSWATFKQNIGEGNGSLYNGSVYLKCGPKAYWSVNKNAFKVVGSGNIWLDTPNYWVDYKYRIDVVDLAGAVSIPNNSFMGFNRLKAVIVNYGVDSIGTNCFLGCNNIKDFYYDEHIDWDFGIQIFDGNDSLLNATMHTYEPGDIVFIDKPEDEDVENEDTATFYANVYCSVGYNCDWWQIDKDGNRSIVGNHNSLFLDVDASPEMDGYYYYLNIYGPRQVQTDPVRLYVSSSVPTIKTSPKDFARVGIAGQVGKSVTISVNATGGGLHYQWQKYKSSTGWVNIDDNDTASLTVTILEGDDDAKYRCVVSNLLGSVTSSSWRVMILRQVDPNSAIKPPVEKKEKLPHNFVNQLEVVSGIPS